MDLKYRVRTPIALIEENFLRPQREGNMPTDDQDNTQPNPTGARVVSSRDLPGCSPFSNTRIKSALAIWPWFDGFGLMALSNRRQTSPNQLSEGTRHEYLSED
jgi:hypothetical protein